MLDSLGPWLPFTAALAAFLASHAIPARPPVRRRLVALLGEQPYLLLYSLASLLLIAWLFAAAGEAPYIELWPYADWQPLVPRILVPIAFALAAVGLFTPNPLSLSAKRQGGGEDATILAVTRHPVLWALALWAGAHLLPNGDLAHVLLFGMLLLLALGGMAILDRRATRRLGQDRWTQRAAQSPLIPFSRPQTLRLPSTRELGLAGLGLVAAGLMAVLHQALIGVPAI